MNRISQTHEQAPPIVDQSNAASEQPAALQVLCREPAPAPLVFQFVEPVLAVRPIAIQLTQGQNFAVQRGDQRGVFPDLAFASDLGEAQLRQRRMRAVNHRQRTIQLATQQDHPALPAPTHQPQARLPALPALAGVGRIALQHRLLQRAIHIPRGTQAEQIGHSFPLGARHHRLVAPLRVTAQQGRPARPSKAVEQRPQPIRRRLDIVLVAGLHVDAQHQAQRRHHVRVIAMRRSTRLARVVAQDGAFLRAVQRLDRRVDIENPRLLQQWRHAVIKMSLQPIHARGFIDLRQPAAHRVLAHHLAHAEQGRVHRVTAQRRDVRIALMTGENRQQQRAEHVALARRIRTGEPRCCSWPLRASAESADSLEMTTDLAVALAHPAGEQSEIEEWSAIADTFGGRVHVEWDAAEPVTPLGQLPFFVEYLKQGGLFDGWVADCPLSFTSPNAPRKRDVLGTLLLSVLAGHQRYAHITALRCDPVNPPLLGMRKVVSEDAVRRGLAKIDETAGMDWLQAHLDYCVSPLLQEPWVLDVDTTIKPLYGTQEGAVVGYNPRKPGRPSHCYHTYMMSP